MDYFERKKLEDKAQYYRTGCWILAVIIAVLCFLWYRSDNGRMKWVHELQDQIAEQEGIIDDLHTEIEGLKEECGV